MLSYLRSVTLTLRPELALKCAPCSNQVTPQEMKL